MRLIRRRRGESPAYVLDPGAISDTGSPLESAPGNVVQLHAERLYRLWICGSGFESLPLPTVFCGRLNLRKTSATPKQEPTSDEKRECRCHQHRHGDAINGYRLTPRSCRQPDENSDRSRKNGWI